MSRLILVIFHSLAMAISTLLLPCLCVAAQVKAWTVTSYYETSITTIPNPFYPGGTVSETSVVTIPVFPTAAVSTISAFTITDRDGFSIPISLSSKP